MKDVCILNSRPHPAGIENPARIEALAHALGQRRQAPAPRAQKHRPRRVRRPAHGSASRALPRRRRSNARDLTWHRRRAAAPPRSGHRPNRRAPLPRPVRPARGRFRRHARAPSKCARHRARQPAPRRRTASRRGSLARMSAREPLRAWPGGHRTSPALPARLGDAPPRARRLRAERPSPPRPRSQSRQCRSASGDAK